jgi:hypothetical protein
VKSRVFTAENGGTKGEGQVKKSERLSVCIQETIYGLLEQIVPITFIACLSTLNRLELLAAPKAMLAGFKTAQDGRRK